MRLTAIYNALNAYRNGLVTAWEQRNNELEQLEYRKADYVPKAYKEMNKRIDDEYALKRSVLRQTAREVINPIIEAFQGKEISVTAEPPTAEQLRLIEALKVFNFPATEGLHHSTATKSYIQSAMNAMEDNVIGVNAVLEIARANGVTGIKHPPLFGTTEAEHYTRELISFINNYLKIDVLGDRAYHGKKVSDLSNRGEAHSVNSDFTNATAGMMYDKEFSSPEEMTLKFTSCPPKHFQKFSDTLNSIE